MANENYSGLNVSTGIGDGDANVLHWGAVDKAADRLYQEQLYRRRLAQQNYQMQQAQFQKELGSIRSADIPDAVNAYNNRKQIAQQLYFDKNLHKDPVKFAQAQMALKQADADYYATINGSKEKFGSLKGTSEDVYNHPDLYNDDAHDQIMKWQNIPTKELNAQALDSPDAIKYKGTDTDFAAIKKTAMGEPQEYAIGKETLSPDQQAFQTQYYKRTAQPEQYKGSIIGQLAKRKSGRDAYLFLSQIPKEDFEDVNKRYEAIPPDQYKMLYGKEKPNLDPTNPDNAADVLSSFEAKKYVLDNPPQKSKVEKRTNLDYASNLAFEHAKTLLGMRHANAKDLLKAKQAYKKLDKVGQGVYLDKIIQSQYDNAKAAGAYTYDDGKGNKVIEYQMKVSPMTKAIFKVGDVYPDAVRTMPNGDIHPIFYKYEKDPTTGVYKPVPSKSKKGSFEVDTQLSQPVSKEEYKIRLGQQLLSDKGLDKELYDEFGGEDEEDDSDGDDWEAYKVK